VSASGLPTGLFARYGPQDDFKSKGRKLRSFINFRDLHFHFGSFSVRGHLGPVGYRLAYLTDMTQKTISNQKVVNYKVVALLAQKSCALRLRGFELTASPRA
jgi:hypothetical protein